VIKEPGDLARATDTESSQMEMSPKAFGEKDLNKYLDGLPLKPPPQPSGTGPELKKDR
jgi:hypothetical protein